MDRTTKQPWGTWSGTSWCAMASKRICTQLSWTAWRVSLKGTNKKGTYKIKTPIMKIPTPTWTVAYQAKFTTIALRNTLHHSSHQTTNKRIEQQPLLNWPRSLNWLPILLGCILLSKPKSLILTKTRINKLKSYSNWTSNLAKPKKTPA